MEEQFEAILEVQRTSNHQQPITPQVSQSPTVPAHTTVPPASLQNSQTQEDLHMPPYFRARLQIEDVSLTIVIASNIQYLPLAHMVDAKVTQYTNRSIVNKTAKLRYRDEDGDFVTIDGDEALEFLFLEWLEQRHDVFADGMIGEVQLYFHPVYS